MNKKQKQIIFQGIILLVLIFLFPLCEKITWDESKVTSREYDRFEKILKHEKNETHHTAIVEYGVRFIVLINRSDGYAEYQIVPSLVFAEISIVMLSVVGLLFVYKDPPAA